MQKINDQRRSDLHVVFTVILCDANVCILYGMSKKLTDVANTCDFSHANHETTSVLEI